MAQSAPTLERRTTMPPMFPLTTERTYDTLVRSWRNTRHSVLSVRQIAVAGAPRTLLCAELGAWDRPAIHISAGVHGDEPAAPWALLSLVRDGLLDLRFSYRLWPCLNPGGYTAGTRENPDGIDINRSFSRGGTSAEARTVITANRDRRFVLALDLHEDFEADGAYAYEPEAGEPPLLARAVVGALDAAGLPVQTFAPGFDLATPVVPRLERGAVYLDARAEMEAFAGWPSALHHVRRGTPRTLTFESPRPRPWEERIAAHRVAVTAAIAALHAMGAEPPRRTDAGHA